MQLISISNQQKNDKPSQITVTIWYCPQYSIEEIEVVTLFCATNIYFNSFPFILILSPIVSHLHLYKYFNHLTTIIFKATSEIETSISQHCVFLSGSYNQDDRLISMFVSTRVYQLRDITTLLYIPINAFLHLK